MPAKRRRTTCPSAATLAILVLGLSGCTGTDTPSATQPETPVATTLTVSPSSLAFSSLGESAQLTAEVLDQNGSVMSGAAVEWGTSDPSIATVSSTGLVESVASGPGTITATSGSASGTASVAVQQMGPSGGEVSLAEAAVRLVLPPGALSEAVYLTAEPAADLPVDPEVIPGTAFDFGPDGIVFDEPVTLTIGYDPAELPSGASEQGLGLHKLIDDEYVRVDGSAVDVSTNSVSGTISGFSVFAVLYTAPLDRDGAIAAARAEYIDQAAMENYLVATMGLEPLPAGTSVRKNHRPDHAVLETVLETESYFALVDRLPLADLPHPFTYVFVDAQTGEVTTDHAWYPPLIDGVPTYTTYEQRTDPTHRFEPVDLEAPHPPEMDGVFEFAEDPSSEPAAAGSALRSTPTMAPGDGGRRIAIGVAGGRDIWHANTVDLFAERMADAGFETEKYFSKDHTLDELKRLIVERTAGLGEGDKVVLYIHIHAWIDDENDDGVLDHPSQALVYDYGGENQKTWSVLDNREGSVADFLDDIPAESVNIVMQACGGAGTLVNRLANPRGGTPFQAYPGSTVRVYASSAQDRVSKNSAGVVGPSQSIYMGWFLDYLQENPLDANGNGTTTLDEIENGFAEGHEAATDGFATGGLSTFDQKPPPVGTFPGGTLQIDAPGDGSVFPFGELVVFQGQGWDPVKGSLILGDLSWESDIDGVLGTGNTVPRSDLSEGEHTITLTGTFSGGVTVTRTIKVTIGIGGIPQASLTSPLTGGTYRRGEDTIEFAGTATDPEDGDIVSLQFVRWISSIDGEFGVGTSTTSSTLSEGVHTITFEVTDMDGNISRATTQITVLTGVPVVNIAGPADGHTVNHGQLISFVGSALDPEDGSIPGSSLVWTSSIDGQFLTGSSDILALSPGVHTVTLTATDSDGNTGTAQITVVVKFPTGVSLTGSHASDTGPYVWPPTISNPGPIELVTEVVDGVMFLTIKSDADLRGEYDPETGEWMATGETIIPGEGTWRETYEGTWEEEDGEMVFRGTLTYEFTPEDGSEPGTVTYDVELRQH